MRIGKRKVSIDETIKNFYEAKGVKEKEVRNGGQRRKVSEVRAKISFQFRNEMGISHGGDRKARGSLPVGNR